MRAVAAIAVMTVGVPGLATAWAALTAGPSRGLHGGIDNGAGLLLPLLGGGRTDRFGGHRDGADRQQW
jgi:hypothetical protein